MSEEELDRLDEISRAVKEVAGAISVRGAIAGNDAAGGSVSCLTEAVMGITAGLFRVAESLDGVAGAIRDHAERSTQE